MVQELQKLHGRLTWGAKQVDFHEKSHVEQQLDVGEYVSGQKQTVVNEQGID